MHVLASSNYLEVPICPACWEGKGDVQTVALLKPRCKATAALNVAA